MKTASTADGRRGGAGTVKRTELLPREYLRVIAIWSLIPSYMLAGGAIGYAIDIKVTNSFPYITGLALLGAFAMSVRDMLRLRDTM